MTESECMMRINPHLTFNGQCEVAFRFYEKCLHGRVSLMMTYGESPLAGQTPAAWHSKILHATLELDDQVLTGGDALPGGYQKPQGFSVLLSLATPGEADRIFEALAENGEVQFAIQETFWAARFGMLTDQFGTPRMINCGRPA